MDKRLAPVAFSAPATFAAAAADGTRRFEACAYGGGVITDHPLFDRVAFDLSSTKVQTPGPALLDHKGRAGVIDAAEVNGKISIRGKLFSDVDGPGKEVAQLHDRGMPWQMSVGIYPGQIENIKPGTKVNLNGQVFDGPLTVFRNNRVREVSFCSNGADETTSAQIFTIGGDVPRKGVSMEFTHTQADVDAAVKIEKDRADKATADLAAFQAQATASRNAARTALLKAHFTDLPKDFQEARDWKPYMDMSDEQFSLVTQFFKKPAAVDASLLTEKATNGAGGDTAVLDTVPKIQAAATKFMVDQKAIGIEVSVADAVSFVTKKGQQS